MRNLCITVFMALLLAGCSSPEPKIPENVAGIENLTVIDPNINPPTGINFKKVAKYGDTEEVMIGRLANVTVDNQGRVFIADGELNYIHVFNADGTYLDSLGRQGKGPGEFGNIATINSDDTYLYAQDWSQRRLNLYDLGTMNFDRTISLSPKEQDIEALSGMYPSGFDVRSDGKFLISFGKPYGMDASEDDERKNPYYLMNKEGVFEKEKLFEQKVDEFLIYREGNSITFMTPSFVRKSLFETGPDDRIYTVWTENFLIKVHSPDGSYKRAYYMPYSKPPLDIAEVLKNYDSDRSRKMIRNADSPDTWPTINALKIDGNNRMWVSTFTDDLDSFDWYIINQEGELVGRFTWPQDKELITVNGNDLYTEETDEQTGLRQVVRYKIKF